MWNGSYNLGLLLDICSWNLSKIQIWSCVTWTVWSKSVEFTQMAKTRENVNSSQDLVELFLSLLVKPQPVSSLPRSLSSIEWDQVQFRSRGKFYHLIKDWRGMNSCSKACTSLNRLMVGLVYSVLICGVGSEVLAGQAYLCAQGSRSKC